MGAVPAGAGRRDHGGEKPQRPRVTRARPAGARHSHRIRPLRPAPASHADRLRHPARSSRRALARHAPAVELTGLAAGFHAVAHLPGSVDEQAVIAAARARSVGLYGMSDCRMNGATTPPQLVLGFGNITDRAIRAGIATIGDLLSP